MGTKSMVRQIKIDGDLILGGLFPVHAKGLGSKPCGQLWEGRGLHRVEAMLFALDKINNDDTILPGIKLGALILDSCSTPAFALNQSLDFVRDMIGTMDADQYVCQDGSNPSALDTGSQPVVGVIGGSYSSVSVQVANLLRLFHIVQISPASTNADLSDKTRFEYFARTVPSDNFQARAMVDICASFNWTYVSLVYSAEEYGELAADTFKKEARKQNLCIATEEKIAKREAIPESIENLMKK
uniref:Receptor ligand binding region domain-containing protein n=1 Tax=Plectus sambesii TaxID=2011161 RepID=A0A914ULZ8_9BILA